MAPGGVEPPHADSKDRPVVVDEKVAIQGHWLVVEEIVEQADVQKTGVVNAKHADSAR
jgi:hypothetical protein